MASRKILFVGTMLLCLASGVGAQPTADEIVGSRVFREIGPTRQGGRVVTFAVSPSDPFTFFVGAGPGGLWKTTNNGTTYEPVFDHEPVASVGHVAIAPSDSNIVWVGTGEANLRNSTYFGNGVYRSANGGASWEHRGLDESHHIGRVVVHPTDPDTVYVAAQGHLYSENPERGVFKTTDGGLSWHKSLDVVIDGRSIGATEVVMDPDIPDTLFAVAYDRRRFPWGFRIAGPGSGIYKTTDAGGSWRHLAKGLPSGNLGKIGLDIYPGNTDLLYAIVDIQDSPGVDPGQRWDEISDGARPGEEPIGQAVFRSDDAGESWRQISPPGEKIGTRSNYYGQIIIHPTDPDHLYVLGMRVWESTDGGATWSHVIRYGGDNHVLWIDPRDPRHMLMGYDYGMAVTHDGGANWYHPDELPMAQIYAVGVDMDYPYNVYCGMQDFGSWKGPSTKKGRFPIRFEDWSHVNGGDGFYNQVDPENSRWLYSGSQFGHITRIDQQTGARKTIVDDESAPNRFNWNTPILVSPHDSEVLYVGGNVLLRSDNRGDSWVPVSPDLTRQDESKLNGVGAVRYGTITTIDQSALASGVLWVGTDDGNLHVSRDEGATWSDVTGALNAVSNVDGYLVSRVEASHQNDRTAYVSLTGFHHDDFRPLVFKTSDFGATWKSVSSNLPSGAVNVIQEDHRNVDLLFVGTDFGVQASLDGGGSWSPMRNGIPTIAVHDLVVHPRENDLVVGTHGRGVFIADVSALQQMTAEIRNQTAHLFEIDPKVQWVMPSQPAVSAQNFSGGNEPFGVVADYYLRQSTKEPALIQIFSGDELLQEVVGERSAGLHAIEWGMTRTRPRSEEEMSEWDSEREMLASDIEFFDYYDTVDNHGDLEEEVDRWGRSMRTRVHPGLDWTERAQAYYRVPPGEYRIRLHAGGEIREQRVTLLEDVWYDD